MARVPDRTPAHLLRFLGHLLRRSATPAQPTWPESLVPSSGRVYIVADGLGSRSTPFRSYTPWLELLRPIILQAEPDAVPVGLSYVEPGEGYGPASTEISLLFDVPRLFAPYAPTLTRQTTYVGFSLGASLLTLGLGASFPQSRSVPQVIHNVRVPALILVQPALALQEPYIEAAKVFAKEPDGLAAPIQELLDLGESLRERFVQASESVAGSGTKVVLLYWPGDQFIAYPSQLMRDIRRAGVILRRLTLPSSQTADAYEQFQQHTNVAPHPRTLNGLRLVLARLIN